VITKAISTLKSKRKALESLSVYLTTSFLAKSLSFLLLPWFTYYLSPSDFGVINLFSGGITFLSPLIAMGVIYNLSIDYYKIKHAENIQKVYHGILTALVISMFIIFILFLFANQIENIFNLPKIFIYYIPIIAIMNFLFDLLSLIYRLDEKPYHFSMLVVSKLILELSISYFLIKFLNQGLIGRINGISYSYLIILFFLFSFIYKNKNIAFRFDPQIIKEDLKLGAIGILSQTSVFILFTSDRFIITYFLGNKYTGIYSIGATFAFILIVVISACLNYFTPKFYKSLSEKNYKSFKNNFKYYAIIIFIATVLIMLITPIIFQYFINDQFNSGLKIFFILIGGIFLWSFTNVFINLMWFFKMKKQIVIFSLVSILLHLILLYFGTSIWKIQGTAFTIIISNTILFLIYLWVISKPLIKIRDEAISKIN
jgi:O-antigen/teichoic acid export membrane protein